MKLLSLLLSFFFSGILFGQNFQSIYENHPTVPKGVLEVVSFCNTRMVHLENTSTSCSDIPKAKGILGLFDDGKNYFKENAKLVATYSGVSVEDQLISAENQLDAYAMCFSAIYDSIITTGENNSRALYRTFELLSEIPDLGLVNAYAKDAQIYQYMAFLQHNAFASIHDFTPYHFNLATIFGGENLAVLSSSKITLSQHGIQSANGESYALSPEKSAEYGPAIWDPAPSCNYSSRDGTAISAITIHTVQGTYAGAISWAQNCDSDVSFHYVIRSSDGQVTQLVLEADKAWHVGTENPYTIGYEHEGYVDDPSWYTEAMYESSADLSRDVVNSGYGIPPLRTYFGPAASGTDVLGGCTKIKGHQHFPNQTHTDPGINWDWEKYYRLINNSPAITTITDASGTLTDSGGATGEYANDERELWRIEPSNVNSITTDFTAFDIEADWDYFFIYDGNNLDAPLIGQYTGVNSPGTITSSGNVLLLEFRSDCATTAPGWEASFTSDPADITPPITQISNPTDWVTGDFTATFSDTDVDNDVNDKFFLALDRENVSTDWSSSIAHGFLYEKFSSSTANWTVISGDYALVDSSYVNSNTSEGNSNAYVEIQQDNTGGILYDWKMRFLSTATNQRAGMHFMCSDPTLENRGDSYFVYLRESDDLVQIYSVDNDVFTMEAQESFIIEPNTTYAVRTLFREDGSIFVFVDNNLVCSWQDATPLISGQAVSLRTGDAAVEFDDITIWKPRESFAAITVGNNEMMRYESVGAIPTGKIIANSMDAVNLWSENTEIEVLIDRSAPTVNYLHDGTAEDIDSLYGTDISANWEMTDVHSSIAEYSYSIGTNPGQDDVVAWNTNGLNTTITEVLTNSIYNQVYYINVSAENGAGIYGNYSTDGQLLLEGNASLAVNKLATVEVYPNPVESDLHLENIEGKTEVLLFDANGKEVLRQTVQTETTTISLHTLRAGTYQVVLKNKEQFIVHQLVKR